METFKFIVIGSLLFAILLGVQELNTTLHLIGDGLIECE